MTAGRVVRLVTVMCLSAVATSMPFASPVSPVPVVVALGDSVPAGTACGCEPFPQLYARMLAPEARAVNLAQPGYTAVDVQNQVSGGDLRADLGAASVVIVMVGANDMAEVFDDGGDYPAAADRVRAAVTGIVTAVRRGRRTPVKVFVVGYWNVVKDGAAGFAAYGSDGMRSAESATRYGNEALRAAAEQTGAVYVTTEAAFKGADRSGDPTGLLAVDGDHPDAAGHEAIAKAIHAAE
ncbi:SGNH/GDSL hydrolase family protein [Actinoplanes sp. NPDC020271]|uniref:SGNH/GDSL hydrolase family protein n=1 Tax=Actinoplanes sp. NPDC020271 TaxID=3363896 RepID=UPI00379885FC